MTRLFIELSPFRAYLDQLSFGQKLLRELQRALVENPEKGDLIQGTGGVRKLRLAAPGRGKSGGFRLWYLYLPEFERIYLLVLYAKNEAENLTTAEKTEIKKLVDILKKEVRR